MTDMLEEFQAEINDFLDAFGCVHYLLYDKSGHIRHISLSFARLCNRKYFDLINSDVELLPLFTFTDYQEFVPVGETDLFSKSGKSSSKNSRKLHQLKNTVGNVFVVTLDHKEVTIGTETFQLYLLLDQAVSEDFFRKSHMYDQVFHDSSEAIVITDATPHILSVNSSFSRITGFSAEEVIGKNPSILASGYHNQAFYEKFWTRLENEDRWAGRLVNRRKNGEIFSEQSTVRSIRNESGDVTNYIAIFSELAEQKTREGKSKREMLHHDDLTGLPKRGILEDRLEQALGFAKRHDLRVAVFYINLDHFKIINNEYGSKVGDDAIKVIAKEINAHIRDEDTLARIVGDEYALLLRDIKPDFDIDDYSSRLLKLVENASAHIKKKVNISASIGVTCFPDDNTHGSKLLRHAQHAMNIAKTEGRNCYVYYSIEREQQKDIARKAKQAVMNAIENNELLLYVQPQYDYIEETMHGIELLIRWKNEYDELIYPDQFLNSQRDTELLTAVDRWVITRAIELLENGLSPVVEQSLSVGINLTPSSLQNVEFHEWLVNILRVTPRHITELLEIEILEHVALENIDTLKALMASVEPFGVTFSLDDFGTGYSSLSIFNQLSVNTVKIDKTFVREMIIDHKNLSLVKAICEMSKIFDRTIIAEGVEFKEQAELLKMSGCQIIQGYGIARPMDVSAFTEWLNDKTFSDGWY